MGKIELAEHVVMHCVTLFLMMPVSGTLGPRARGRQRIAVGLSQEHTVGCSRQKKIAVPSQRNTELLFEFCRDVCFSICWCCHRVVAFKCSGIARGMKSSASVKLLGRGSGVTSSCLAFELSIGRVTSASVVIEWWHLNVLASPGA